MRTSHLIAAALMGSLGISNLGSNVIHTPPAIISRNREPYVATRRTGRSKKKRRPASVNKGARRTYDFKLYFGISR